MTAVELLPVQAFVDDDFLIKHGIRNYWGYNTIGFFAPESRYSRSDDRAAGHRVQGDGPGVSCRRARSHSRRGLQPHCRSGAYGGDAFVQENDNSTYYRLFSNDPRFYHDVTGTGNTLNHHPQVLNS